MSKGQIVFVDDEINILKSLRGMLSDRTDCWDMTFLDSPEAAWQRVVEGPIDIVVSDIHMPRLDGLTLLDRIRNHEATVGVQVVMLTGLVDRHLKCQALKLGASDLLNKPVDAEDLVARLESVLHAKRVQDRLEAKNRALEDQISRHAHELETTRLELAWRLARAAEQRDEETGNHVVRVGCYSRVIAEAMQLDAHFSDLLFLAAPLHDIGKIGIPDAILNKPGPLSDDEWQVMREHCRIGKEILDGDAHKTTAFRTWQRAYRDLAWGDAVNPVLKMAASIALTHHERWNGTGYPLGLRGDEIPLESRIVTLCDVFDALTSKRPYKPALPETAALDIVEDQMGRHFDPLVCDAFFSSLEQIRCVRQSFSDGVKVSELADTWQEAHAVCG